MRGSPLRASVSPDAEAKVYTLQDVWKAILTEEVFQTEFWLEVTMRILFSSCVRGVGYFLVVLAVVLVAFLGYVGIFVALPQVCERGSIYSYIHSFNGTFIIFNIYFNYYFAVSTSPGHPEGAVASVRTIEDGDTGIQDFKECKKCNAPKPPRSHHCSVCKRCILKMDHHCPYINNCVGHFNYRYFFCFLLWTTVGTFYLSIFSGIAVFDSGNGLMLSNSSHASSEIFDDTKPHLMTERLALRNRVVGRLRKGKNGEISALVEAKLVSYKSCALLHFLFLFSSMSFSISSISSYFYFSSIPSPPPLHPLLLFLLVPFPISISFYHCNTSLFCLFPTSVDSSSLTTGNPVEHPVETIYSSSSSSFFSSTSFTAPSWRIVPQYLQTPLINQIDNVMAADSIWKVILCKESQVLITFAVSVGVCIAVGALFCFHVALVRAGMTTIEYYESWSIRDRMHRNGRVYKNEWDRGLHKNVEAILGNSPWYVAILPSVRQPPKISFSYMESCRDFEI